MTLLEQMAAMETIDANARIKLAHTREEVRRETRKHMPSYERPKPISLSKYELKQLKRRGYEVLQELGEGQTRNAYLAKYTRGDVKRLRVVKISKREVDPESVRTQMNLDRKDLDLAEVKASNEIKHPNIISVVDNFRLNGRTVNVEDYYEGTDLETTIRQTGPLTNKSRAVNIARQISSAVDYLNNDRCILHRDIKPSNVVLTRSGQVMLGDLQTAARIQDIKNASIPTFGGAKHTHPYLLSALITGDPAEATRRTEVYSFGTTLWHMLTGEDAFDYKLTSDPGGRVVEWEGEVYRFKLTDGEKVLEHVSKDEHESRLKAGLKKVPSEWRKLVYRCLTLDDKVAIQNISGVNRYLDKIDAGLAGKVKEAVTSSLKYALPAAIVSGVISLGIWGAFGPKPEAKPTMSEILRRSDYRAFNLETLDPNEKNYAYDLLIPYMEKAKKNLPQIEAAKIYPEVRNMTNFSETVHSMPRRLVSSWLRACYLSHKAGRVYKSSGEERIGPSFVPLHFVQVNDMSSHATDLEDQSAIAFGCMYLKQCLGPEHNVADVFASYFSSSEDINAAKVKTRSADYLPREVVGEHSATIERGYHALLPPHERELINMATALYLITDEDGNIDFDKIPKRDFFPGAYTSRWDKPIK